MKKFTIFSLMIIFICAGIFASPPETYTHQKAKRSMPSKAPAKKTRAPAVKKPENAQKTKTAPPSAETKKVSIPRKPAFSESNIKENLIQKLSKSFPRKELVELFSDQRMKLDRTIFEPKSFTCTLPDGTKRPHQGYYDPICGILSPRSLDAGKTFYLQNRDALQSAYEKYGVDPSLIVATSRVESYFGQALGDYKILTTLYTLYVLPPGPRWRDLALEHIDYFLRLAKIRQWDIFTLKGSARGAIGIPQFMPFAYWHYAVDGNNDGKIDLFDHTDAIHSIANFYIEHGWLKAANDPRKAIANYYGRDQDGYVDAVLAYVRTIKNIIDEIETLASEEPKTTEIEQNTEPTTPLFQPCSLCPENSGDDNPEDSEDDNSEEKL